MCSKQGVLYNSRFCYVQYAATSWFQLHVMKYTFWFQLRGTDEAALFCCKTLKKYMTKKLKDSKFHCNELVKLSHFQQTYDQHYCHKCHKKATYCHIHTTMVLIYYNMAKNLSFLVSINITIQSQKGSPAILPQIPHPYHNGINQPQHSQKSEFSS